MSRPAQSASEASPWWREWSGGILIEDTLAEKYLCGTRDLRVPVGASGRVLRFRPQCPFGDRLHPCLLALYRDIITDEPRAIHRTALSTVGTKIDRKAWGPIRGAAIKISDNADVTSGLIIGEGLETTLAGMMLGLSPAWATVSAGAIAAFPLLPAIETLTILVDNDESGTGQRAAEQCAARWIAAGREVLRVIPRRIGADLDDIRRAS